MNVPLSWWHHHHHQQQQRRRNIIPIRPCYTVGSGSGDNDNDSWSWLWWLLYSGCGGYYGGVIVVVCCHRHRRPWTCALWLECAWGTVLYLSFRPVQPQPVYYRQCTTLVSYGSVVSVWLGSARLDSTRLDSTWLNCVYVPHDTGMVCQRWWIFSI